MRYRFKRKGKQKAWVEERVKKAMRVMGQMWEIRKR